MRYWLMKTEPTTYSIDDLQRDGTSAWEGVRNYQARNFMRDQMKVGDLALFYHSNATPPGVVGVCTITKENFPDTTALDVKSLYFDPKASEDNPIWMTVEVKFFEKFPKMFTLEEIRKTVGLEDMLLLKKFMRLSVMPIEKQHFNIIRKLGLKS